MAEIIKLNTEISVLNSRDELNSEEGDLLNVAINQAANAYAPYSEFYVGAAVLLENGLIIGGNNQENAAYPSGLCAERVALFFASAQYPEQKVKAIAVYAASQKIPVLTPVTPCGACRQVMAEYEHKHDSPIKIIMAGEQGQVYICLSVSVLLPLMFNKKSLLL